MSGAHLTSAIKRADLLKDACRRFLPASHSDVQAIPFNLVLTLKNRRRVCLSVGLSSSKMCSSLTVELVADGHMSIEVIRSALQEGVQLG